MELNFGYKLGEFDPERYIQCLDKPGCHDKAKLAKECFIFHKTHKDSTCSHEHASLIWEWIEGFAKPFWLELATKVIEKYQLCQDSRDQILREARLLHCFYDDIWKHNDVFPVDRGQWEKDPNRNFIYRKGLWTLYLFVPEKEPIRARVSCEFKGKRVVDFYGNVFCLAARLRATLQHNGSDLDDRDIELLRHAWHFGTLE